ncbi:MAG TPA: BatA and WFA domain-containing protein [Verrucomicrobiae bacterium]|nr:BatA and WFA domain-containing protein [Verrucomicrobiae bacterium]
MSFLTPIALAFAASIPVVIVFYLLKRKRVVKLVSSTLLWQKFLAETQANAPFQRLRHNWLLILQLLLLVLVVLALARPYFAGQAKSSRLRVVILDASASMQSTDERPSRFENARSEALKLVDGLRDNDQMVVLQSAANTEVKQSATSDKMALRRALESCVAVDSPTRLAEAFKLAETLVRNQPDAEIHLFSDGAIGNLSEFENQNLPLVYHKSGKGQNNLGIVSLDVRANPDDPAQRAIFTSVGNFSTNVQQAELELLFDNDVLEVRPLTLPATNTQPLVFIAPQSKDGVFTVRLKAPDDLAADNQASIVSLMPQPVKVLLVTRANRFLEKALKAPPNVELSVASSLGDTAPGFDLVVLDDVLPTAWPKGNILAIHVVNTNWFGGWDTVKAPAIVDWKNTHPLLRFVSFDNVQITEAIGVKKPLWAVSLVDSPQTPLILTGDLERQRIVWIGFDTLQSTWPLRISFPIFIANAVDWLNPSATSSAQLMVRAGDAFRLPLSHSITSAKITGPDGKSRPVELESKVHELVFGETYKNGVYRLIAGTNVTTFCVNLLDAAESNIMPREELPFGRYGKVAATKLKSANSELWRWLAMAGLGVLLFEWWWYHKRTV